MSKPMKVSLSIGKGNINHNTRQYDYSKDNHVDPTRTHLNRYISINPKHGQDFEAVEKEFYKQHFQDWSEERIFLAKKNGHPERKKTADQFRTGRITSPQEMILQIGDKDLAPSTEEFNEWLDKMLKYQTEITKGHCKILNVAVHNDEYTPHAHVRFVLIAQEESKKNGEMISKIKKTKALEAAGIQRPDLTKRETRYNNPQVTFTKMLREKAEELAKEMGFEIDTQRSNRRHLDKDQYIELQEKKELVEQLSIEIQELENPNFGKSHFDR